MLLLYINISNVILITFIIINICYYSCCCCCASQSAVYSFRSSSICICMYVCMYHEQANPARESSRTSAGGSLRRSVQLTKRACHILPPSEIDLGPCLAVFAGSGGRYLFHRNGWKGRTWQLRQMKRWGGFGRHHLSDATCLIKRPHTCHTYMYIYIYIYICIWKSDKWCETGGSPWSWHWGLWLLRNLASCCL